MTSQSQLWVYNSENRFVGSFTITHAVLSQSTDILKTTYSGTPTGHLRLTHLLFAGGVDETSVQLRGDDRDGNQ